jgi:hypothetical protein
LAGRNSFVSIAGSLVYGSLVRSFGHLVQLEPEEAPGSAVEKLHEVAIHEIASYWLDDFHDNPALSTAITGCNYPHPIAHFRARTRCLSRISHEQFLQSFACCDSSALSAVAYARCAACLA